MVSQKKKLRELRLKTPRRLGRCPEKRRSPPVKERRRYAVVVILNSGASLRLRRSYRTLLSSTRRRSTRWP